mmetsp:Transcript_3850/g.7522  ORF Transcript_3850/g.7522 Transcript_3850/m.7522 type:complete len:355 (-) Transcript_3850:116-1180(-)
MASPSVIDADFAAFRASLVDGEEWGSAANVSASRFYHKHPLVTNADRCKNITSGEVGQSSSSSSSSSFSSAHLFASAASNTPSSEAAPSSPLPSFSLASLAVSDLASFRVRLLHLRRLHPRARKDLLNEMGMAAQHAARTEAVTAAEISAQSENIKMQKHRQKKVEGEKDQGDNGDSNIKDVEGEGDAKVLRKRNEKEREREAVAAACAFFAQGVEDPSWIKQSKARETVEAASIRAKDREASTALLQSALAQSEERVQKVKSMASGFGARNEIFKVSQRRASSSPATHRLNRLEAALQHSRGLSREAAKKVRAFKVRQETQRREQQYDDALRQQRQREFGHAARKRVALRGKL